VACVLSIQRLGLVQIVRSSLRTVDVCCDVCVVCVICDFSLINLYSNRAISKKLNSRTPSQKKNENQGERLSPV
jgi:hypothetical protein